MDSLLTTSQSSHRRILELTAAIKSMFEPVILTHLYPRSLVDIFVQVQQDGGLLSAFISAITLELIIIDIALFDSAPTVSSGVHFTLPLLGPTTLEENDVLHLTIAVVPRTGKVTLMTLKIRIHDSEEDNESDSDNILSENELTPYDLVLPSSARIGHRSMQRYYVPAILLPFQSRCSEWR